MKGLRDMHENATAATPQRRDRIIGLDIIKALAIMEVLALHTGLWCTDFISSGSLARVVQYAMRLASEGVPLFVMVNGFLLLGKSRFNGHKHLMKTLHLCMILVVWMTILTIAGAALHGEPLTIRAFAECILTTSISNRYTGVLWFLQGLIAVYLIYPVLKYLYENNYRLYLYLSVVFTVFSIGLNAMALIRDALAIFTDATPIDELIGFARTLDPTGNAYYVYCFMLGGAIYHWQDKLREYRRQLVAAGVASWALVTVIGIALSFSAGVTYTESFNYGSPFMTLMMLGLMAACLPNESISSTPCVLIEGLGSCTMGIYLIHRIIVWAIVAMGGWPLHGLPGRLAEWACVLLVSWGLTYLAKEIPCIRQFFE